jgi:acetyl esterase
MLRSLTSCLRASGVPPEWTECTIDDDAKASMQVRIYGAPRKAAAPALVVHFHGGAFVAGSLDSGVTVARLLVSAGAVVVSVDYPLAPAQPFPAAVEAGHAALLWAHRMRTRLAGKDARLFVAGEEAGGNLAAALAMVARDRHLPPLAGQILLSPMLDACVGTASMRSSEAGAAGCRWAEGWCAYLGCGPAAEHPYAIPARALRLSGLPPALVITAGDDPLRDEALVYAERLRVAGAEVNCAVLAEATGWPCSLGLEATAPPRWADPVREALGAFLYGGADEPSHALEPSSSPHSTQSQPRQESFHE